MRWIRSRWWSRREVEDLAIEKGKDYVTPRRVPPYAINTHRLLRASDQWKGGFLVKKFLLLLFKFFRRVLEKFGR